MIYLKLKIGHNKKYQIEKIYNNIVYTKELKTRYLLSILEKTFLLVSNSDNH